MSAQPFDAVLASTEPQPRTRVRVEHSRTQRDGWGYSTTVEVEYPGTNVRTDADALIRLEELLGQARIIGQRERDARNAESGVAS
jgi:hypothetical protein